MTKLTGRILVSELQRLNSDFRHRRQAFCADVIASYSERAFEIVSTWASERFPAADVAILDRYGYMIDEKGFNVRVYENGYRKIRFGFTFPEGKTVRLPGNIRGSFSDYSEFSLDGGIDLELSGVNPRGLTILCEDVARDQASFEKEGCEWQTYLDGANTATKKPLRAEVAARFPWTQHELNIMGRYRQCRRSRLG